MKKLTNKQGVVCYLWWRRAGTSHLQEWPRDESNLHLHDSKMVKDRKSKCYGTHGEQPAGAR